MFVDHDQSVSGAFRGFSTLTCRITWQINAHYANATYHAGFGLVTPDRDREKRAAMTSPGTPASKPMTKKAASEILKEAFASKDDRDDPIITDDDQEGSLPMTTHDHDWQHRT